MGDEDSSPFEISVNAHPDATGLAEGSACTFFMLIFVLAIALGGGARPRRAKLIDREIRDAGVLRLCFCLMLRGVREGFISPGSLSGSVIMPRLGLLLS